MTRHARLLVCAALLLAGCSKAPDLDPIEEAFQPGTPGLATAESITANTPDADIDAQEARGERPVPPRPEGARVPTALAGSPFGVMVAQAVRLSPQLRITEARVRGASAAERAESGAFLPQLSVGAQAGSTASTGFDTDAVTPLARVTQLVYDGGAASGRRTAARARLLERRGQRLEEAASVTLSAVEAYYSLVSQRRILQVAQENLAAHRRLAGQIRERADRGAGSRADVLTAQSRLADAVALEAEAQSRLDRAEAAFNELYGRPPPGLPAPRPAPALPDLPTDRIVDESPRMRAVKAAVKAAEADLSVARAGWLPTLSLGATGRSDTDGDSDLTFDMVLNYDVTTRGRRAAEIESAEAEVQARLAERDSLAREIRRTLDFVRSDQRAGSVRLEAARMAAEANAASVAAMDEQFSIGRRSLIELLDAQRDYRSAREAVIRAEQERALTDYAALALTGDILDAFAIGISAMIDPS